VSRFADSTSEVLRYWVIVEDAQVERGLRQLRHVCANEVSAVAGAASIVLTAATLLSGHGGGSARSAWLMPIPLGTAYGDRR
jgi:hypothetical protein